MRALMDSQNRIGEALALALFFALATSAAHAPDYRPEAGSPSGVPAAGAPATLGLDDPTAADFSPVLW